MIRDSYSGALLETDLIELEKYRKEKKREKEFSVLVKEVQTLKQSVENLKITIKNIEAKL
jgi:hypothetical protein